MTKRRIEGRVKDSMYEIVAPDGGVTKQIPLSEARGDRQLAKAIARNGWEALPDG